MTKFGGRRQPSSRSNTGFPVRITEAQIERATQQRLREEAEEREAQAERLRHEEKQRTDQVKDEVARWHMACDIREYVAATLELLEKHSAHATADGTFGRWLSWMEGYADRIDPLTPVKAALEDLKKQSTVALSPTDGKHEAP